MEEGQFLSVISKKIVQQVFSVIPKGARSLCEKGQQCPIIWTKEEHTLLCKGIKKHGEDWEKIAADLLIKPLKRVRTYGEQLLNNIECVFKVKNPLEFVQTKSFEELLDPLLGPFNESHTKKKKPTFASQGENLHKRALICGKRPASEVPECPSLDSHNFPLSKPLSPRVPTSNTQTSVMKLRQSQRIIVLEAKKKEMLKERKNTSKKILEKEEEKGASGKNEYPLPEPTPKALELYMEIMQEVQKVTKRLELEFPNFKAQAEKDPSIEYHWNLIYSCSISLQQILNEISHGAPPQMSFMPPAIPDTNQPPFFYGAEHP